MGRISSRVGIVAAVFAAGFLAAAPAVRGQGVETYGTTPVSYTVVGSNAFIPSDNTIVYTNVEYLTSTSGGLFTSNPPLPSGALLVSVQWTFCSPSPSTAPYHAAGMLGRGGNEIGFESSASQPIGPGCTNLTDDVSGHNWVVDNQQNRVELAVTPAVTADYFTEAIIGYRLQVSPAPGTATFGDVPTSHPFFQYVEALAASGITGGCGSGNYCPDTPVTRGQMAVFLSKALGLQWP
ncbi:MAG TPA: S-layer homology domain-containing protein [Thermoanaerobaculia bacterium]|jgi:hypothetical protein|nr:S-layer homology domain-containing protein [Thermoanaerobaculia bacterium]